MLAAEYAGWDEPVLETISALDQTFRWGIYDRAPLPYWSTGRMTLLGDAAHPIVPHLGQGAAQAIEDAFTLAVLLEGTKRLDVPRQLKAYERLRLARTSQIQTMARETGRFFRAEYQDVAERDRLMARWMAATDGSAGTMRRRLPKKPYYYPVATRRLDEAPARTMAHSTPSAKDRSLASASFIRSILKGSKRVELTRSPSPRGMTAICAQAPAHCVAVTDASRDRVWPWRCSPVVE
jgi:hypothetical protein